MADTLINAISLREYFDISADIIDGRLTPHIGAASRRLKAWVGAEAYADALEVAPTNPLRAEDLKNAEAALAMHFAVPGLNTKLTPGGVVKTSKVEGNTVLSYLTPNETRQLKELYLEQAEELARPYALADGTPDAEFALVSE